MLNYSVIDTSKKSQYLLNTLEKSTLVTLPLLFKFFTSHLRVILEIMA